MLKKVLLLLMLLAAGLGLLLLTARHSHYEAHREVRLSSSPQRIWQLLVDIDHWQNWWPGVEKASLRGPLAVGSRIELKLQGLPPGKPAKLVTLVPQRQLEWAGSGVLGSKVATLVALQPKPQGCEVLIRNSITGPQAVLARYINSDDFSSYQQLFLKTLERRLQQPAVEKPGGEKD